MRKKYILGLIALICMLLTIYYIMDTLAIFESIVTGEVEVQNGKWIIHINNTDISTGNNKEFVIDQIDIEGSNRIEQGKIAPGLSGKFDVVIDPNGTDVSVRYDIEFDLSKLEGTKIRINSIEETEMGNMFIQTGENTYTGIILLDDIRNGAKHNITAQFDWQEDETTDEEDSKIGAIPNNKISIPVSVKVSQYLGEEVEEYSK